MVNKQFHPTALLVLFTVFVGLTTIACDSSRDETVVPIEFLGERNKSSRRTSSASIRRSAEPPSEKTKKDESSNPQQTEAESDPFIRMMNRVTYDITRPQYGQQIVDAAISSQTKTQRHYFLALYMDMTLIGEFPKILGQLASCRRKLRRQYCMIRRSRR